MKDKSEVAQPNGNISKAAAIQYYSTPAALNEIMGVIWKMASALFTIAVITGYTILNKYANQINQKDLMLELVNSPTTFLIMAILPFIASMFVACAQSLLILVGVMLSEGYKNGLKNKIETYVFITVYIIIAAIILTGVFFVFNCMVGIVAVVMSLLSFFLAICTGVRYWFVHIIFYSITFIAISVWSMDNIGKNDFKIMETYGVAEKAADAKWYILHPASNSHTINGMTASDIQLLRKQFNMGAPQDNHWSYSNNALYGYLAWNIGNERVLCSPYQDHRICIRLPKENIQLAPNIN